MNIYVSAIVFLIYIFIGQAAHANTILPADVTLQDWRPKQGMVFEKGAELGPSGEPTLTLSGRQGGEWRYGTLDVAVSNFVLGKYYRLDSVIKSLFGGYSPLYIKIVQTDSANKVIASDETLPLNPLRIGSWQELHKDFYLRPETTRCVILLSKGTNEEIQASFLIARMSLSQAPGVNERAAFSVPPPGLANLAGTRPRILIDQRKIIDIRGKLSEPPYATFWSHVRSQADQIAKETPPIDSSLLDDNRIRELGWKLPYVSLAYLLTGEERYAAAARKWMNALVSYPHWATDKDIGAGNILSDMSLTYDWLFSFFTPEERSLYRAKLLYHADIFYKLLTEKGVYWANPESAHNATNVMGLGFAGLALYGEVPEAESWLAAADDNYTDVLTLLSPDGADHQGVAYAATKAESILKYLIAMTPLYGNEKLAGNQYFRNYPKYRLYMSLPGYKDNVDYGDSPRFEWDGPGCILRELAGLYRDGNAQWLAEKIDEARGEKSRLSWLDLLWYDDSVTPVSPEGLPLYALFDNLGFFVARSSWAVNAAWTFFKAGSPRGKVAEGMGLYGDSHVHPDQGSFLLWNMGGWLVIDDGYVLQKRTANHNCLLFNGVGQLGEGGPWFNSEAVRRGAGSASIIYSDLTPAYQYLIADLTGIYPKEARLKNWQRTFVHLGGGVLVIRDDVEPLEAGSIKSSLHFESKGIKLQGNSLVYNDKAILQVYDTGTNLSLDNYMIDSKEYTKADYTNAEGQMMTIGIDGEARLSTVLVVNIDGQQDNITGLLSPPVQFKQIFAEQKDIGKQTTLNEGSVITVRSNGKDYLVDFDKRSVTSTVVK